MYIQAEIYEERNVFLFVYWISFQRKASFLNGLVFIDWLLAVSKIQLVKGTIGLSAGKVQTFYLLDHWVTYEPWYE